MAAPVTSRALWAGGMVVGRSMADSRASRSQARCGGPCLPAPGQRLAAGCRGGARSVRRRAGRRSGSRGVVMRASLLGVQRVQPDRRRLHHLGGEVAGDGGHRQILEELAGWLAGLAAWRMGIERRPPGGWEVGAAPGGAAGGAGELACELRRRGSPLAAGRCRRRRASVGSRPARSGRTQAARGPRPCLAAAAAAIHTATRPV